MSERKVPLTLRALEKRLQALERLTADRMAEVARKVINDEVRRMVEGKLWDDMRGEVHRIERDLMEAVRHHTVRIEVQHIAPPASPQHETERTR